MSEVSTRKRGTKWEYYFEGARISNQRKKISKSGFLTKKEAIEAGIKAANEYNNSGFHFVASEVSFSDYLDFWIDNYCSVNLKPTTISGYSKRIRLYIKPALGKYKLKSLTPATLQEFINKMFHSGLSRNTLASLKGILSGSIGYAIHPLMFIQNNPMTYVKIPSPRAQSDIPTRSKQRHAISKADIDTIFSKFPKGHIYHLPLQLAYRCGLRLGEAFALTWDDIDFQQSIISVKKQVQIENHIWYFSNPKYDSVRTIKIDSTLLNLLKDEKNKQHDNEINYGNFFTCYYVNDRKQIITTATENKIHFVNRREDGSYIQPRVMQHCSRVIHYDLNIPTFDYHSLRHTHTTFLIEGGANPKDVQYRLGHKDIKVTLGIYAELTDKMKDKSIKIIEDIF